MSRKRNTLIEMMRNWAPVEECVGVDLGDKESVWCRVGRDARVTGRGRMKMTQGGVKQVFAKMEPTRVVLENGTHARWVMKVIAECGHEVIVADPRQLHYISRSSNKNDNVDAEKLARLGRVDLHLLHPIQLRSDEQQADLGIIRCRRQLVETRVALAHQVRGVAKSTGRRLPAGRAGSWEAWVNRARAAVEEWGLTALLPLLAVLDSLNEQIAVCDRQIDYLAEHKYPETQWLTSVPAVGNLTAVTFVLTLGNAERFSHSRDVGAYLGMRPRRSDSGESEPQLRITKQGDHYLRMLLVQSAQHYLTPRGPDNDVRRWGMQLCARGGKNAKKRAMVAVARKLSVILHRMWVSGERFRSFACRSEAMMSSSTA